MADKLEIEIALKAAKETEAALKRIRDGVKGAGDDAVKSESVFTKFGKNLKKNFIAIGAGVIAFQRQFSGLIDAYRKQEQAERQLEARLKSTGNAVGLSADALKRLASELQSVTTFGDEAILEMENLLLTFTKIGKDVFPAATEAALDMSTAFGQDLRSTAIQLGKALNEPVEGVSALRRVGVQLTDEQEKQIKKFVELNDIAGAQGIILAELATQTGGAARAAAQGTGQIDQFKNMWGDLQETLGKLVIPVLITIIDGFNKLPNILKLTGVAMMAVVPAVIALQAAFGPWGVALGAVAVGLTLLIGKLSAIGKLNAQDVEIAERQQKIATRQKKDAEERIKVLENERKALDSVAIATKKTNDWNKASIENAELLSEQNRKLSAANQALTKSSDILSRAKQQGVVSTKDISAATQAYTDAQKKLNAEMAKGSDEQEEYKAKTDKTTESANGFNRVLGEIGGTDGALVSSILNMVELGNVSEVAGDQAQTAGEKAEAAWTKVLGVIGLVKAALNEIAFMFEFFAEVAGDEGNSKAERVLTAISKILTSMATGSPWKVIKAIRDVVMGGREDAAEREAAGETGAVSAQAEKEKNAGRVIAAIATGGASEVGRLIGKGISKIRGRATGGAVSGNEPYMVGERGPEMFLPSQNGSIIPSHNVTNNKGMTFNNVTIKADNPEQFFDQLQRYQRQHGVLA